MKQFLYLFLSLIGLSCTGKAPSSDTVVISCREVSGEKKITDLFDSFQYTVLEASDESLLGMIDKLILYKEQYYILDKVSTKKIYVFNKDGSLSHQIGAVGGGPGEYRNVEDFTIDEEKEQLVILTYPSTVYIYNLQGDFQYSKPIAQALFWNIMSYKNGFVCSTNHLNYTEGEHAFLLFFFDKEFNLQYKLLSVLPYQISIPLFISAPLTRSENDIVYFDNFTATLYLLPMDDPEKIRSIQFDIESKSPSEVFGNMQSLFMNPGDYSVFLEAFYSDGTLWSFFGNKGQVCSLIADIITGEKSIHYLISWFPKILFYQDGFFYSTVNPQQILENKDNLFSPAKDTKFSLNEDSNPLLIKFKAK